MNVFQIIKKNIFLKHTKTSLRRTKMVISIQVTIVEQNSNIFIGEGLQSRAIHHQATMKQIIYSTTILLVNQ